MYNFKIVWNKRRRSLYFTSIPYTWQHFSPVYGLEDRTRKRRFVPLFWDFRFLCLLTHDSPRTYRVLARNTVLKCFNKAWPLDRRAALVNC